MITNSNQTRFIPKLYSDKIFFAIFLTDNIKSCSNFTVVSPAECFRFNSPKNTIKDSSELDVKGIFTISMKRKTRQQDKLEEEEKLKVFHGKKFKFISKN